VPAGKTPRGRGGEGEAASARGVQSPAGTVPWHTPVCRNWTWCSVTFVKVEPVLPLAVGRSAAAFSGLPEKRDHVSFTPPNE